MAERVEDALDVPASVINEGDHEDGQKKECGVRKVEPLSMKTRPFSGAHRQAGLCNWEVGKKRAPLQHGRDARRTVNDPVRPVVMHGASRL
jgi:hypothetical protein